MPRENKEEEEEQKARTAYDLIRMRLDRLQKNIEKPVSIPQRRDSRKPRPPPDFVRNVVGSSAAAGSAEFHIFRNNRKREMDRQRYKEKMKLLKNKKKRKEVAEESDDGDPGTSEEDGSSDEQPNKNENTAGENERKSSENVSETGKRSNEAVEPTQTPLSENSPEHSTKEESENSENIT
ncbi:unnamed protein product [Gongylonema pulchrum]|uniref:Uncharacterized protein n=1 Tax=Gongylonema pulchrum TaxID=637853 RepID=A0A183E1I2_9BILA|nr:unnamed protein product [Gongylonema pulchrum]